MIRYADIESRADVRRMWKTVFGDCDEYMDIYFREKYADERTLIYWENDKPVASLQLLPYDFTFCGTEIPIAYFSGVCTLPEARRKGYMNQLIIAALKEMHKKEIPLTLLVPQEEWLLNFYRKYGFAQTFDKGDEDLPSLEKLLKRFPNDLHAAYREFNTWFRQADVTVQKSFDDFRTIVEEAALFQFPTKRNLPGMARVIDAQALLTTFAQRYENKEFSITVTDELLEHNNASFSISSGQCVKNGKQSNLHFRADIGTLAQLLLGYHTSEREAPLSSIFPEKTPQMHFMLE